MKQLFVHHAQAITCALEGKHVVVATSTSSGKSMCYNVPVLESLQRDPQVIIELQYTWLLFRLEAILKMFACCILSNCVCKDFELGMSFNLMSQLYLHRHARCTSSQPRHWHKINYEP